MSNNTDELVLSVRGMCITVARKVGHWYNINWTGSGEDIVSAAYVGACIAANKFDSSRGVKFNTYAYYYILRFAINEAYNICVLRGYRTMKYHKDIRDRLSFSSLDQPSVFSDSQANQKLFFDAKDLYSRVENAGNYHSSIIEATDSDYAIQSDHSFLQEDLSRALDQLPPDQQECLTLWIFGGLTIKDIGIFIYNKMTKSFGISKHVVSEIIKRGLSNLRKSSLLEGYR